MFVVTDAFYNYQCKAKQALLNNFGNCCLKSDLNELFAMSKILLLQKSYQPQRSLFYTSFGHHLKQMHLDMNSKYMPSTTFLSNIKDSLKILLRDFINSTDSYMKRRNDLKCGIQSLINSSKNELVQN